MANGNGTLRVLGIVGSVIVTVCTGTFAAVSHFAKQADVDVLDQRVDGIQESEAKQNQKLDDLKETVTAIAKKVGAIP